MIDVIVAETIAILALSYVCYSLNKEVSTVSSKLEVLDDDFQYMVNARIEDGKVFREQIKNRDLEIISLNKKFGVSQ